MNDYDQNTRRVITAALIWLCFSAFFCSQTGPSAPKALSELSCLRDYLASPTPPKKSSKNAIVYSERMLEMEQVLILIVADSFRTTNKHENLPLGHSNYLGLRRDRLVEISFGLVECHAKHRTSRRASIYAPSALTTRVTAGAWCMSMKSSTLPVSYNGITKKRGNQHRLFAVFAAATAAGV